jgi:hypothetical protein
MPTLLIIRKVSSNRPEIHKKQYSNGTALQAGAVEAYNGRRIESGIPKFNPKTDLLLSWDAEFEELKSFSVDELAEETD